MADRYLVKDSQNRVVNIILWDGVSPLSLGEGLTTEKDTAKTRQIYSKPGPVTVSLEDRVAKLETDVETIRTR